jgi:hypothetical protein
VSLPCARCDIIEIAAARLIPERAVSAPRCGRNHNADAPSGGVRLAGEKYILLSPPNSDEKDFQIGDELTVFESAMIYAGRHPHSRFLKDGSIHDHLIFLRGGIREREPRTRIGTRSRRSWDIFCEIIERIKAGRIQPVKLAYDAEGQIDPIRTVIRTSDLQHLATERREQPKCLKHLQTARKLPETQKREVSALRKSRARPALERATKAIKSIYPNGIPDQSAVPNAILFGKVGTWLKDSGMPDVGNDTILRAAGRRK